MQNRQTIRLAVLHHCFTWALASACLSTAGDCDKVDIGDDVEGTALADVSLLQLDSKVQRDLHSRAIAVPPVEHRVEHREILNNERVWLLAGAVVIGMGLAVIGIEVGDAKFEKSHSGSDTGKGDGDSVTTRDAVHLMFCVVAFNICHGLWGISQEFVMTNQYRNADGSVEALPSSLFILFCNRMLSAVFTGSLCCLIGKPLFCNGFAACTMPSVSNAFASFCQYRSLDYVSFILQATAKSGKLLPVIMIGSLRGKRYGLLDYAETLVIVSGLVVFGVETITADSDSFNLAGIGVLLLLGCIFFDALTPHLQEMVFEKYPALDSLQATFASSMIASVGLLLILMFNGSLATSVQFLSHHLDALLHITLLGASSCLSMYFIIYIVKHFGPLVFAIIATTSQMIAVCISAVLFDHRMTPVAIVAGILVFGTVFVRACRAALPRSIQRNDEADGPAGQLLQYDVLRWVSRLSGFRSFFLCTCGIHVFFCVYGVLEEFLTTHSFEGEIFRYVTFNLAVNNTFGTLLAVMALRSQGLPLVPVGMKWTLLPSAASFVSTELQHQALYFILFPTQTLMKTLRLIPVMLIGTLMQTRSYSAVDYMEGVLITGLVSFFVWDFQLGLYDASKTVSADQNSADQKIAAIWTSLIGVAMMLAYVVVSAVFNNLEDYVYQKTVLDPGHMLLGLELSSAVSSWASLLLGGQLWPALTFVAKHNDIILYLVLLGVAAAFGTYSCTLTVRLFGPAVFTLVMMSRQIFSLLLSVFVFQHDIDLLNCVCLIVLAFLMLTSSLRHVSIQIGRDGNEEGLLRQKP